MKVMVTGVRGLPGVEGGVESHVEQLYRRLAEQGVEVEVAVRSPFQPADTGTNWRSLRLRRFWSPKTKGLEALIHTFLAVCWAAIARPDVLHIHAVGPGLFTPLARLFGLKVVFTHHGPDYDREKWGTVAKGVLRLGESLACRFANERISISRTIQNLIQDQYGVSSRLIPNGVPEAVFQTPGALLRQFDLEPGKYILQVSRLVPEKRQLDLMAAFKQAELAGWKLVLTGRLDSSDRYMQQVMQQADSSENIVLTDFRSGNELAELLTNAGLFVLPSAHEGLPIALLEALSYGLRVLASDIPANMEVGLDDAQYFVLGEVDELAQRLSCLTSIPVTELQKQQTIAWVQRKYNWDQIACDTLEAVSAAAAGPHRVLQD